VNLHFSKLHCQVRCQFLNRVQSDSLILHRRPTGTLAPMAPVGWSNTVILHCQILILSKTSATCKPMTGLQQLPHTSGLTTSEILELLTAPTATSRHIPTGKRNMHSVWSTTQQTFNNVVKASALSLMMTVVHSTSAHYNNMYL